MPRRPALVAVLASLALGGTALVSPVASSAADAPAIAEHVTFTQWDFGDANPGGSFAGTRRTGGRDGHVLRLKHPAATSTYTDPYAATPTPRTYDEGTWTSPTVRTPFGLTELVSSWNAHTPGGSWLEVTVQGVADDGSTSKWYVLGRWADHDSEIHPTSLGGQADSLATVSIDTLVTRNAHTFDSYRIRVSLLRPTGSRVTPTVDMVGAMASSGTDSPTPPAAPPTTTRGRRNPTPSPAPARGCGPCCASAPRGMTWNPRSPRSPRRASIRATSSSAPTTDTPARWSTTATWTASCATPSPAAATP